MIIVPKSLTGPVVVERHDLDSGEIVYELWDHGTSTYHCLCHVRESLNDHAKAEAEFMALAINNAIGALKQIERRSL